MRHVLFIVAALLGVATLLGLYRGWIEVPEHMDPRAPLRLDAPVNFLTRYKLNRLSKNSLPCQDVLASSGFRYERLSDRTTGDACGFSNAVRIDATGVAVSEAFSLTCRAAVSLALWERHVLQPTALDTFGQPVARIEHFGSYSCRNVYGRANATRSRHATAEAFDVAGFVLADGQRIRVLNDWSGGDTKANFLRAIRTGACQYFDAVLSPDYNDAHRDHFHFDRGPARVCR